VGKLADFVTTTRSVGVTIPIIAGVAVYTDDRSAGVLAAFPGLHLDPADIARVVGADDPRAIGIEAAVQEALDLLAVPGVAGVNLSGLASGRGEIAAAHVKAEVAQQIRDRLADAR
jgi:5,10-methylenetetrahydrofolate reductase